jgi:predicted ATPase
MMGAVVPTVSLLERDEQLAQLRSAVDAARAGAGRLIVVTGEAGVGKTALVESIGDFEGQVRVWTGSCEQLFTARPHGPSRRKCFCVTPVR